MNFEYKESSLNQNPDRDFPPSSFSAFNQLDQSIDGVILTDFDTKFNNQFFLFINLHIL